MIDRATVYLNDQNLVAIEADCGPSIFRFDLDGLLETWPYEEDDQREQWIICRDDDCFDYRGDGYFWQGACNTMPGAKVWQVLA